MLQNEKENQSTKDCIVHLFAYPVSLMLTNRTKLSFRNWLFSVFNPHGSSGTNPKACLQRWAQNQAFLLKSPHCDSAMGSGLRSIPLDAGMVFLYHLPELCAFRRSAITIHAELAAGIPGFSCLNLAAAVVELLLFPAPQCGV